MPAAEPVTETPPMPIGEPTSVEETGGLPVRARGKSLESAGPLAGIERRATDTADAEEQSTDNSAEGAGNFSSMMTALSSGISRGLQESEQDPQSSDQDRNQDS